ncbi:PD-(D/E)XK nuclease family protein [bacterium]|nr:PD-(D/E)XK nuclease family protein [bacterium]
MFTRHEIPFDTPFLPALARLLLDACGDRLPRALVLLPSSRACGSLRHALLEASGGDGLLLPRILKPGDLVEELAGRLGVDETVAVPPDLRAEVLAPRLTDLAWIHDRPGAAAGTAEQLMRIFDELRRSEQDPGALDDGGPAAPEPMRRDVARVREAWRLYRTAVPRDDLDRELAVVAAAAEAASWPGAPVGDLFVAGFSDLDSLGAQLIRIVAAASETAHLLGFSPGEADLTRLFLTSYSDRDAPTHPLAPGRRVASLLLGKSQGEQGRDTRPYKERLEALASPAKTLAPGGEPLLYACPDPEQESLKVTDLVVEQLRRDPLSRIAVATADRTLARRIADQLFDAGLDLDVTDGDPLTTHADGRLVWALLRAALTDLHGDPLLELLTHPLVTLGQDRVAHARRTLSFEKQVLRGWTSGGGLAALRQRARECDDELQRRDRAGSPEMSDLVDDLAGCLDGLLGLAAGPPADLAEHVAVLRAAWSMAAPDEVLAASGRDEPLKPARRRLVELLDALTDVSPAMPPLKSEEFAALLSRQLGRIQVRPLRSEHLPVQVTGLLEVRLETYDLLVMAGMGESVFPDEPRHRTLLLGPPWRVGHDLLDWRHDLGLDAELFLRLLHNGARVAVTWSREKDGDPTLPSPLVERLLLADPGAANKVDHVTRWRREPDRSDRIGVDQAAFADEPRVRAVLGEPRRLRSISHTALDTYRACPYRFLLERGYELREDERILEELRKKDYGTIAHDALKRFLRPDGPGEAALRAADRATALAALRADVHAAFDSEIGTLPQRRLWAASLLALGDALVDSEIARARRWRIVTREAAFSFNLGELRDWLVAREATHSPLPAEAGAIEIKGRLDRVDATADGSEIRVIDYKTGSLPAAARVASGEDLQLAIYALAVRLGKVEGAPADAALSGVYYGLKRDEVGYRRDKPHLGTDHDLCRDGEAVLATALAMVDPDRGFDLIPSGEDPDRQGAPCRWCAWRGVCRVDEITERATREAVS